MEPASVSLTLRKVLAWMTPATPPPPPPRRRPRVRFRTRRQLPGARWRLPLAQLVAAGALLVVLSGCGSRTPSVIAGPVVLAVSVLGLCLRPARAAQVRTPAAPAARCIPIRAGNLTRRHDARHGCAASTSRPPDVPDAAVQTVSACADIPVRIAPSAAVPS